MPADIALARPRLEPGLAGLLLGGRVPECFELRLGSDVLARGRGLARRGGRLWLRARFRTGGERGSRRRAGLPLGLVLRTLPGSALGLGRHGLGVVGARGYRSSAGHGREGPRRGGHGDGRVLFGGLRPAPCGRLRGGGWMGALGGELRCLGEQPCDRLNRGLKRVESSLDIRVVGVARCGIGISPVNGVGHHVSWCWSGGSGWSAGKWDRSHFTSPVERAWESDGERSPQCPGHPSTGPRLLSQRQFEAPAPPGADRAARAGARASGCRAPGRSPATRPAP